MNSNDFLTMFLNAQIWLVVKLFVILALLIYLIFAIVIIRQVDLMTKAINFSLDGILKIIAVIHFVGAIVIFLVALIVL
ncbi:hypothetical protein COT44_03575 [Candidatus Shapirobacteria bacterium CG08_land_8_20_14_0_20_39_18]|uniref:Uncharacterized protein n=1 Tax=Candidatus Shapirobacteria bacterium CG08_land_8_20_14_0_20_39_18 TaxID=1974883 RepID=A0A2M6XCW6_9BACT|nr:MAG: hypothetical protein COT44_03575 [Candidatus Shapirobacteria bacterium CG08_land_8_20_14_0_20_39_18]PJE67998.1 MAG: hypothetical protein COU94_04120 [Candidatus Shapirobacteria bacterium CG10_big_fil_rev_8_21_14_0_10_38_8]